VARARGRRDVRPAVRRPPGADPAAAGGGLGRSAAQGAGAGRADGRVARRRRPC
jgi:hypothetical protein